MKILFIIPAALLLTATIWAQSPQKMSYQAVIRDASNNLVKNLPVGMQISILQGSETGTPVYVETQTTTTNANGLVSIEIGGGTPVTGTFAGIDWSTGPYFIKTETDPTGGTDYTITGTSQLLSVPYALCAETVTTNANLTGMVTSTGNTTTVVTNADLSGEVTSAGNLTTISNSAIIGKVLTGYVSGAGTVTAADNILQAIQKLNGNNPAHYIGESYGGGIVFYVYDNGLHGLIAAIADQSTGIVWTTTAFQTTVSNAVRDGINGGFTNTERIIIQAGAGSYAAQLCANYQGGNFADWYLPSISELNLLLSQWSVLGLSTNFYWSSTERDNSSIYILNRFGNNPSAYKNNIYVYVRAIRAF